MFSRGEEGEVIWEVKGRILEREEERTLRESERSFRHKERVAEREE